MENDTDDDELQSRAARETTFSQDLNQEEMFNPINPFGIRNGVDPSLKRKAWMEEANGNTSMFTKQENGESNICKDVKRMKENTHLDDEDADDLEQDKTEQRVWWVQNHIFCHEDTKLELSRSRQ